MPRIWKKEIELTDFQKFELPAGHTFLSLETQKGKPTIWFWVPDIHSKETESFRLRLVGTGNQIPEDAKLDNYIGTFQMDEGSFVFHAFIIDRTCSVCGCTDYDCDQCIKKTGEPCFWISEDLCSACFDEAPIEKTEFKSNSNN